MAKLFNRGFYKLISVRKHATMFSLIQIYPSLYKAKDLIYFLTIHVLIYYFYFVA